MKLLIAGASGLVGQTILKVIAERQFPYTELLLAASDKSAGKTIPCGSKNAVLITMAEALSRKPDLAIFSAGGKTSLEWAPKLAAQGCIVIDNSSAWRMDKNVPLVVPEVNPHTITHEHRIIANPNCSTIQMLVAIAPLYKAFGIKRLVISTYQSVTGTGQKAIQQLEAERNNETCESVYPHPIHNNCFPHGGDFMENGYTSEEMKLVNETRKILADDDLRITATVVRIPVTGGHSEAVNIEFKQAVDEITLRNILRNAPGIQLMDDPNRNTYPTPLLAAGQDNVLVGRIRRDNTVESGFDLWIVADNLRKGAATNAVQIAEYLLLNNFISVIK
jgi:aspartate-semialdehyde dehydrogenase